MTGGCGDDGEVEAICKTEQHRDTVHPQPRNASGFLNSVHVKHDSSVTTTKPHVQTTQTDFTATGLISEKRSVYHFIQFNPIHLMYCILEGFQIFVIESNEPEINTCSQKVRVDDDVYHIVG